MSTFDLSMMMNGVQRGPARPQDSALRMVLVEGEALRLPLSGLRVRVLSGTAWITQSGVHTLLKEGGAFNLTAATDRAVISPLGNVPLLFEVR